MKGSPVADPTLAPASNDAKIKSKQSPLVWMDLEMTGLEPERDVIIEIATIITDHQLNIIAEGPDLVIHRDPSLFDTMDNWNQEHHSKSGLWQKVVSSTISEKDAEEETLSFIKKHVAQRESPLCGNTIWQDRRFLLRYMKNLEAWLHYRLVDVSTIKELAARWYPSTTALFAKKKNAHRALDDCRESIEEMRQYRETFFRGDLK
jgi:oligoribonuclease